MDSKSIRYQNTRQLVISVGGISSFADRINKGQSQTSQFAGTNPIKGIGNKVAREIEVAFGKPYGWLDTQHSSIEGLRNANETVSELDPDLIKVPGDEFESLISKLIEINSKGKLTPELLKVIRAVVDTVPIS